MADETLPPSSTEPTSTTSETTTALGDGLAKASDQTQTTTSELASGIKPAAPEPVPEKYEAWKLPEGYEMDAEASADIEPLFKELGLSQAKAQKLIDAYAKHSVKTAEELNSRASRWWNDRQQEWREDMKKDPELAKVASPNGNFGPDSKLIQTVNAALNDLQNPKLVSDFKEAMDFTGAGNNPAFVKVFYALASKVTEGTSYATGGNPVNNARRVTPAGAMYPNLKSEAELRGG